VTILTEKINIILPLKINIPRKTKKDRSVYLNLNTYRNLHYVVNNQVKKIFKESLKSDLYGIKMSNQVKITYTYYANSNRKSDLSNMCSIVDKFFCDALTYYGCIPDDNYEHVVEVIYKYGGVDKGQGRVEVLVESKF
jgi:hypothetical protein